MAGLDHLGSLEVGKRADLVVLSEDLKINYTVSNGKIIYKNSEKMGSLWLFI